MLQKHSSCHVLAQKPNRRYKLTVLERGLAYNMAAVDPALYDTSDLPKSVAHAIQGVNGVDQGVNAGCWSSLQSSNAAQACQASICCMRAQQQRQAHCLINRAWQMMSLLFPPHCLTTAGMSFAKPCCWYRKWSECKVPVNSPELQRCRHQSDVNLLHKRSAAETMWQ